MTRRPAPSLLALAVLAASLTGCGTDPGAGQAASPGATTATEPAAEPTSGGAATGESGGTGAADGDWTTLTDEPSGTQFALPGRVDKWNDTTAVDGGSEVTLRNYMSAAPGGDVKLGFIVLDTPGESYDLDAGVAGVEESLDGTVVKSTDIEVDGYRAVDVELSYGADMLVRFQLIRADDHVIQPLATGRESVRKQVERAFDKLNMSVEVD